MTKIETNADFQGADEVITLDTGKQVGFRALKISDISTASEMAGAKATSPYGYASQVNAEIMKLILVSIDGKVLKGHEKESLDSIMSVPEYMACLDYVGECAGKSKISGRKLKGSGSK